MTEHDLQEKLESVESSSQVDVDTVQFCPVEFFRSLPHPDEEHVRDDEKDGSRSHTNQRRPLSSSKC